MYVKLNGAFMYVELDEKPKLQATTNNKDVGSFDTMDMKVVAIFHNE